MPAASNSQNKAKTRTDAGKQGPQPTLPQNQHAGRRPYIECLRIIAVFLVVVNHTNSRIFTSLAPSPVWYLSLTYFFICKVAVPIYLFIMGAVLLEKQDPARRTVSRILRIAAVIVVFSAIYYVYYNRATPEALSVSAFFKSVYSSHMTNAFWYLYTYLGLLCMLPILQKMAAALSKRQLELLLLLSLGLGGLFPLIRVFTTGPSTLFTLPFFSPYLGMVFAGYYIERYLVIDRRKALFASGLFVALIAFQVIATRSFYESDPSSYLRLDNRTFITITGSAICVYIVVKYLFSVVSLPDCSRRAVCYVGGLTFVIYLLSDLIISVSTPLYTTLSSHIPAFLAMICWEVLIVLAGGLVAAAIRAIPGLKKWL